MRLFSLPAILVLISVITSFGSQLSAVEDAVRSNIVWLIVDDLTAHFSCYNEKTIDTPDIDQLAKDSTMFTQAFVNGFGMLRPAARPSSP